MDDGLGADRSGLLGRFGGLELPRAWCGMATAGDTDADVVPVSAGVVDGADRTDGANRRSALDSGFNRSAELPAWPDAEAIGVAAAAPSLFDILLAPARSSACEALARLVADAWVPVPWWAAALVGAGAWAIGIRESVGLCAGEVVFAEYGDVVVLEPRLEEKQQPCDDHDGQHITPVELGLGP
jgi:hypothetical protein